MVFPNDWKKGRRDVWNALLSQCALLPNEDLQDIAKTLRSFATDVMDDMPAYDKHEKMSVTMAWSMLYANLLSVEATLTLKFEVDIDDVINTGVVRVRFLSDDFARGTPLLRQNMDRLLMSAIRLLKSANKYMATSTMTDVVPATLEADAAEPATLEADAAEPAMVEAGAAEPAMVEADAAEPATLEAGAAEPAMVEAGAAKMPADTLAGLVWLREQVLAAGQDSASVLLHDILHTIMQTNAQANALADVASRLVLIA